MNLIEIFQPLMALHFIRPWWLLALIPAIGLLWLFYRANYQGNSWAGVIDAHLLKHLLPKVAQQKKKSIHGLSALLVLSIFGLSGPSLHKEISPVYQLEKLQVILLDASESTHTTDIKPSRFKRSVLLVRQLLKQHKEGEVMLVAFSGEPYVISPPTSDAKPILNLLEGLNQQTLPVTGSNLALALKYTQSLLKKYDNKQVDILLLTDEHQVGIESLNLAKTLNADNIRLSVLSVATDKAVPIRSSNGFAKDSSGQIIVAKTNQTLLARLSNNGGGLYQALDNDVANIERYLKFSQKNITDKSNKQKDKTSSKWVDSGIYIVLLLIPLLLILFRQGYLLLFVLGFGLFINPQSSYAQDADKPEIKSLSYLEQVWQTQNKQAKALFDAKKYKQSAQLFTDPHWQANALYKAGQYKQAAQIYKTLGDSYNYGNALAKSEKLESAIKQYQQVKPTQTGYKDAQDNLKLVKKILQQQKQQQQQQKGDSDNKEQQQKDQKGPQDPKNKKQQDKSQDKSQDKTQDQLDKEAKQQKAQQDKSKDKSKDKTQDQDKKPKDEDDDKNQAFTDKGKPKSQDEQRKQLQKQEARASQVKKQELEQIFKQVKTRPVDLLKRKFLIERQLRQKNASKFLKK